MLEQTAINLADNLRQLRDLQGLTQQALAKRSGVPRPTLANLETGGANPTLAVLLKVCAALGIRLEELLAAPRASARHYPSGSLPQRLQGRVTVRELLPDALPGAAIERLEMPSGGQLVGVPHTPGTREYLTCERGAMELIVSGQRYALAAGDLVVFRGDQRHSYRNPHDAGAVAYCIVVLSA